MTANKGTDPIWILSIDGGGVRGLIPAIILAEIEKQVSDKLDKDIRIADIFDMVAGTSTGSIISLGLTVPDEKGKLRPASELVTLYENSGKIFRNFSLLNLIKETARQYYNTVLNKFFVIGNPLLKIAAALPANQLEQDHAINIFDPNTHIDLVEGIFGPIGEHTISEEGLVRPVKEHVKSSRLGPSYDAGRPSHDAGRSSYDVRPLEELLDEYFSNKTLEDIVNNVDVLVPAYNMTENEEVYFTNYSGSKNYKGNYKISHVIRASTAAPTCFPAKKIDGSYYIDGGIFMNNPAYKAYLETKRKFSDATKFVVCSLGTGFFQQSLQGLENSGWIWWMSPLIALMMNSSIKLVHDYFEILEPEGLQYYRFQDKLPYDISMDDTSNKAIEELTKIAEKIIDGNEFKKLIKEIVKTKFNGRYSTDDTLVDEQLH